MCSFLPLSPDYRMALCWSPAWTHWSGLKYICHLSSTRRNLLEYSGRNVPNPSLWVTFIYMLVIFRFTVYLLYIIMLILAAVLKYFSNSFMFQAALKEPYRRLVRESKSLSLYLIGGSKLYKNWFVLFNDVFVHIQVKNATFYIIHHCVKTTLTTTLVLWFVTMKLFVFWK